LRFIAAAIAAACVSLSVPAWADAGAPARISKAECEKAFEQSQRMRNTFHYVEASSEALICAASECGAVLSDECGKLYGETLAATPSVVVGARTADGSELRDVSITLDGSEQPVPVDGAPLLLNPGNHEFSFSAVGFEPTKLSVVILAGERLRPIIGVFKRDEAPAPSTIPNAPAPESRSAVASNDRGGPPLASYILGGIGLAGFGGFVGFRLAGAHDYDALSRDCKPTCSQSSVAAARQKYVLSYVGLAIGGAATIAAVTVYLITPGTPSRQAAALQIRQQANGMTAHLSVPF
jgi:hypothetical protein